MLRKRESIRNVTIPIFPRNVCIGSRRIEDKATEHATSTRVKGYRTPKKAKWRTTDQTKIADMPRNRTGIRILIARTLLNAFVETLPYKKEAKKNHTKKIAIATLIFCRMETITYLIGFIDSLMKHHRRSPLFGFGFGG